MTEALDTRLLAMLRCPESGGELHLVEDDADAQFLFCVESRLKFRIDEHAIPVLLLEDAESLSEQQVDELLEQVGKGR